MDGKLCFLNIHTKKNRPIGVTIIAIRAIVSGILSLISGLTLLGSGSLLSDITTTPAGVSNNSNDFQSVGPIFGITLLIMGIAILIIGIGYFVVSYGLLKGKGWAGKITIVLYNIKHCSPNNFRNY